MHLLIIATDLIIAGQDLSGMQYCVVGFFLGNQEKEKLSQEAAMPDPLFCGLSPYLHLCP